MIINQLVNYVGSVTKYLAKLFTHIILLVKTDFQWKWILKPQQEKKNPAISPWWSENRALLGFQDVSGYRFTSCYTADKRSP